MNGRVTLRCAGLLGAALMGLALPVRAQEGEAAAPAEPAAPAAAPCAIAPRTLVRMAVGEGPVIEKSWAMPDSTDGAILYAPAGGRWALAPAAGSGPPMSDPRLVDGAEHIFVPGATFDPLPTAGSEDLSQIWFDWRAPTLLRMVKGRGIVFIAGRAQLVMREGEDLSPGRKLTVAECVECSTSEDPLVREGAAWMLGWIPASAAELDEAERTLGVLMADPHDDVAFLAIESLGRVGRASQQKVLEAAAKGQAGTRAAAMEASANFIRIASVAADETAGTDTRVDAIRAMGATGLPHLFFRRFGELARTKDVYVAAVAVASSPNQRMPGPLGKSFFMKSGLVATFRSTHTAAELEAAKPPTVLKDDPNFKKWVELLFKGQPADLYQRALGLRL